MHDGTHKKQEMATSRLTCSQCDGMLLDAIEDLLLPEDQMQFDRHIAHCATCSQALGDARRGVAWMDMLRDAPPQPPAGLVDSILARTSGNPAVALPNLAASASILGRPHPGRLLPFVPARPANIWARMAHTVAQPRFAMTAAMAFFSIALTLNLMGIRLSDLRASDLQPAHLRRTFWEANAHAVRYYENLRVVYELESRVREMQHEDPGSGSDAVPPAPSTPPAQPSQDTGQHNQQKPAQGGQPHSHIESFGHGHLDASSRADAGQSIEFSQHMLVSQKLERPRQRGARA